MRCIALATELRARGADCYFVCRSHLGNLIGKLIELGFPVHELPPPTVNIVNDDLAHSEWLGVNQSVDAEQTKKVIDMIQADWIVVDHYGIDHRWESMFQEQGVRILVIDDLADRLHQCDLLLDQTFGRSQSDYQECLPDAAVPLIGSQYALLRSEFKEFRELTLAGRENLKADHILVSLGGVDKDNYTGQILRAIASAGSLNHRRFTVVLGAGSPWVDDVTTIASQMSQSVEVVIGSNEMARLMSEADLAIGAAGSSSWERCTLGLPTIQVVTADNQRLIASLLAQANAIKLLEEVQDVVELVETAPSWMSKVSTVCRNIADGCGAQRVADRLMAI